VQSWACKVELGPTRILIVTEELYSNIVVCVVAEELKVWKLEVGLDCIEI